MPKIYANVYADGPDGVKFFEYGSEVPEDYAKGIKAPVWEEPEPGDDNYVPGAAVQLDVSKEEHDALKARAEALEKQLADIQKAEPDRAQAEKDAKAKADAEAKAAADKKAK